MEEKEIYNNGDKNQELIYKLIGTYNILIKELEKVFIPYKISASKFNILMLIKHQYPDEGISQVQICKKLIVGDSNITKLTNKLFEDGYITREINTKDRRYNILKITKKGSDLLDEIWITYKEKVEMITKNLSEKEKNIIIDTLTKWSKNII